ncbi:MAG TPA: hypothetical protein VFS25_00080 [Chitinophaga sp.]|uniref:hypothetical protein n=1 Tax=Chitinophaga sp. TaxID=1869181 RepID=UPI002DB5A369|nr:hypothetical protein [Chitinophaga sp.]HEU4551190.1 hypothetical protein [Chitinophaga sp.]
MKLLRNTIWILLLLPATVAGAQSLQLPAQRADTVKRMPLPAYMITPVSAMAPGTYYQQHFGVFCKQEWLLEKQIHVPVKLRLGTYQYTQRLEGKQ